MSQVVIGQSKAYLYYDASGELGKSQALNGILRIPITIAAEMLQYYHREELPYWLLEGLPKDLMFLPILKDYKELVAMVKRSEPDIPATLDHPEGTFLEDRAPRGAQPPFVKPEEVIGTIKELRGADDCRKIKGYLYAKEDKCGKKLYKDLADGNVVGVSIGFTCRFGDGGTFNSEDYIAKQIDMILGHVAILPQAVGKCPTGICGVNQDSVKEKTDQFVDVTVKNSSSSRTYHLKKLDFAVGSTKLRGETILADEFLLPRQEVFLAEELAKSLPKDQAGLIMSPSLPLSKESKLNTMTPEEIKALAEKDAQLATLKDASATATGQIHTLELQVATLKSQLDEKDKMIADQKVRLTKYETSERDALIVEIAKHYRDGANTIVQDKPIKDHCLHNLQIIKSSLSTLASDSVLAKGLPKPSQAEHDAKGKDDAQSNTLPMADVSNDLRKNIADARAKER